jgi:HEAT repeat protein
MQQWQALGPEAVPMLARALGQGTSPVLRWYRNFRSRMPISLQRHLPRSADTVGIRRSAPLVLAALNCDISAAAKALGRALDDEDSHVRVNASICLKESMPKLGTDKARVVPYLVQAMQDPNNLVRENITQCLGNCPEQSRIVGPALVRGFDDPVQLNRYLAIISLKRMNLDEAAQGGAEPMLVRCLTNSDLEVSLNAAVMLSQLKYDPAREVPAFTELLADQRPGRPRVAAMALGRYGPLASPAIPALQHAFETGDPRLRVAASNALAQIDPQAAAKP